VREVVGMMARQGTQTTEKCHARLHISHTHTAVLRHALQKVPAGTVLPTFLASWMMYLM